MTKVWGTRGKVALTGCTGFVGRQLVPALEARGLRVLLVGRDPDKIKTLFPGREACSYDELEQRGGGCDALLHLAAANNDGHRTEAEFRAINVDFAASTAQRACQAGIEEFVYFSSYHALDLSNEHPYARSKRDAQRALQRIEGIRLLSIYLPAVHGDAWSGKLRFLNYLPKRLAGLIFMFLAAMKPTVNVSIIADFIERRREERQSPEVLLANNQDENPFYRTLMRLIDLTFALTILVSLGWFLVILWILIRLESPGPGVFAQTRVGRYGDLFTCYKLRTMHLGTPQTATHQVGAASITRVGRFLRATKADELLQVFNIIRNDLSLVGPRPGLPVQESLTSLRQEFGVLDIKPGITGYAQVQKIDMRDPQRLAAIDAYYRMIRCIPLNLQIIVRTLAGRGFGDGTGKA